MITPNAPTLLGLLADCLGVSAVAAAKNGGVPEGDYFAVDLGRIVDSPLCRLPQPVKDAARALGAETRKVAVRHKRLRYGQYSRVDGLRSKFPEFCHVFQPEGLEGDDTWLRVALIETAIQKALPREQRDGFRAGHLDKDDRHLLGLIAYLPPLEWDPIFHDLVVQLGAVLTQRAGSLTRLPQIPEKALERVAIANLEPAKARRRVARALVNAFGYIAGVLPKQAEVPKKTSTQPATSPPRGPTSARPRYSLYIDPTGRFPIPESLQTILDSDVEAPPAADFADFPIFARAPTSHSVLEEEGEDVDDEDEASALVNVTAKASQREAEAAHLLFLSGSLQPEVSRVLAPPIFAAVLDFAEARSFTSSGEDPGQQVAWLALMLSGLTSRHPGIVLDALLRLADGNRQVRNDDFAIDPRGFWSRLPQAEVADRKSLPPRLPALHFPWPTTFAEKFWDLWSSRSDWKAVLSADLMPSIRQASQALRDGVFGQFSLLRLRNTLPSAVYTGSGDDCLAQLVSGDTLRHSDGALHYYSNVQGRLRGQFAWALCGWLPRHWMWNVSGQRDDDSVFGLPRSRLPDAEVADAIAILAARADEPPPPRASGADLCGHHNRFTAYVVALFAECTAHRLTEHLEEVTRRHLVLRWASQPYGVATFLDKLTVCALSSRAAAISPMVVVQLEIYLAHLARLVVRLERQGRRHRHAIQALQAAIHGDGPLFINLEHDEQFRGSTHARPFTTADLSGLWPEWRYPGYVLRHRFASFLWRFGFGRDDVARQMGHAVEGVAFDDSDPDSVVRFVERLAHPRRGEREAPLDRALRAEGWRTVRSWTPERLEIPESVADVAASIVAEQAEVLRKHEKLQSNVTAKAMGKSVVIETEVRKGTPDHRRSLFEDAREFARARLDEWLALPEQDQARDAKILRRDDVERLMDFATGAMPDRRYLVPVTNVLRNRLQRMRADESAGWQIQLPAPVSVLRVAPPVITPACARAYNYCSSILDTCDRWIVETPPRPEDLPEAWLGVVVIQLALRNGITRRDLLVDVLANAHRVQRHPLLADTLLVPVGVGLPGTRQAAPVLLAPEDAAKEGSPADSTDDTDEDQRLGEYVTLQGLPAICFQRWARSNSLVVDDDVLDRLGAAVSGFLDRRTGVPPKKPGGVEAFLTCAQLARRLTMPGLRSAWEDGRLSARTIDLDRQMSVWRGDIQRIQDAEPARSSRTARPVVESASAGTAEILTKLREVLTLREGERGRPRSGAAVIADVEELERQYLGLMPTARWAIRYVKARLKKATNRGHRASLYEEYTIWRGPFLAALGESDLADLDPDAMTALLVKATTEGCSDPRRALKVTRGIIRELVADGFEPPDMAELHQAAKVPRPVSVAYLISPREAVWVDRQLQEWARWARTSGVSMGVDAFEIEAASELWGLQFATGVRTAEAVHLRQADVVEISGEWIVIIRRLHRRGAKTDASVRALRLRHFLAPEQLSRFASFVSAQRNAHRMRKDPGVGLFANPAGSTRIAAGGRITLHLNAAMRLILPARSGRPYAGRHARASFAVHRVLPAEHQSPGWIRAEVPAIPAYLGHLSLRFQLRFISRAIGHAYSTSTATFYTHSITDMRLLDRAWGRTPRALMAAASGVNASTLGVRLSRAQVSATDTTRAVGLMLDDLLEFAATGPSASGAPFEVVPPARKIRTATIEQMTRWVREWLAGERVSVLEHRHGISADLLRQIAREFERLEHLHHGGVVDRSVHLDGIDASVLAEQGAGRRRGPRLPSAQAFAEVLDELERSAPDTWHRWVEHLRSQRRGLKNLVSTDDPLIRGVLTKLLTVRSSPDASSPASKGAASESMSTLGLGTSRDLAFVALLILAREQVRLENARLALS